MTASSVFPFPLEFADSTWRSRFTDYGWNRFDSLWNLDATEVDTPNVRRGGWSSVVRMSAPDGSLFYLKRQQNHFYRDPKNFYRKTPTAVREWRSTKELGDAGIGVLNAVCMGMGVSHDASRAVFVTEALTDHRSLPETLQDPALSPAARVELWHALGHLIRRVHRRGYRYNCLYGKHVMLHAATLRKQLGHPADRPRESDQGPICDQRHDQRLESTRSPHRRHEQSRSPGLLGCLFRRH
ncbi:MAG: hypothetical protein O3A63_06960 [Proteobacteria bacterium]|nr:hypothetical protein [Pseudomonadota bacterium]